MNDAENIKDVLYVISCIYVFTIPPLGLAICLLKARDGIKDLCDDLGLSWSGVGQFIEEFNSGVVDRTTCPMMEKYQWKNKK